MSGIAKPTEARRENACLALHVVVLFAWSAFGLAQALPPSSVPTLESLRGISAPSSSVLWASGTHGTYLRTTDAGLHWAPAQVPGAEKLDFRDVEAFSADEAYLLSAGPGDQSRIYKTTDAGQHWSLQFTNTEPKGFFDCMAFWDRDHGLAIGDPVDGHFELLATDDGGTHWTMVPTASRPAAVEGEGAFAASGTCIATQGDQNAWFATGGSASRVFRSSDRGKTWQVAETPIVHGQPSTGIFSIAFRDASHGIIVGGDYLHPEHDGANLATTDDGGANWKAVPIHLPFFFSAVTYLNADGTRVLAVGSSRGVEFDLPRRTIITSEQLSLNAVSRTAPGEAIAVGPKGQIIRWPGNRP